MLASPCVAGEREPRWVGQYDAVACQHLFIHRLTGAVRRGPWVSMLRSEDGRIYYLNLLTSATRWDPPPLWEVQWVRRAPGTETELASTSGWRQGSGSRQVPSAVPRGREVCGGAAVGRDLAAAILPEVELLFQQMLMGADDAAALAVALDAATPSVAGALAWSRLEVLCSFGTALLSAAQERFTLAGAVPQLSLAGLCPALRVAGGKVRAMDLDARQVDSAVSSLRAQLGSPGALSHTLLPALAAVGGFYVYG